MADGFYRLTYRDIAERLGISPDAARMKANRKAKAGHWRLLPDEAPGGERLVEIPSAELDAIIAKAVSAERSAPVEQFAPAKVSVSFDPQHPHLPAATPARSAPAGPAAAPEQSAPPEQPAAPEQAAAEQVGRTERADVHPEPPAGENGAEQAPTAEAETGDALVATLTARVATLTNRLLEETSAREKEREELAASAVRESELKVEIERLSARVSELTEALEADHRPWWRRLIQGGSAE
jgi:hypothetical protein